VSAATETAERVSAPGAVRPLRGSVRAVWAQHRRAGIAGGVLVALVLALAVGLRWWGGSLGSADRDSVSRLHGALTTLTDYGSTALALLPLAVGAFVAGPMIARELESGTYKIAWTQSVSPAQWLMSKLALPLAAVVLATPLLVAAFRLLREPLSGKEYWRFAWFQPTVYEAMGPVAVGYAVLGVAVGTLMGLLVRRTLAAMVGTAATMGALLLVMQQWRDDLWPMRTVVGPHVTQLMPGERLQEWSHGGGWQTATGVRIDTAPCDEAAIQALNAAPDANVYKPTFDKCIAERGGVTQYSDYHGAADFWPLQLVETGILLALAGATVFVAFRVLRRLHG
jgi:hypothetical protein